MANIKETLIARAIAEEAAQPAPLTDWQQQAEDHLKANPNPTHSTVPTFAESIAQTGYPKNLRFCGVHVQIADEEDLAKFWACVYANLPKSDYTELAKPEHDPITEQQVASALMRSYYRVNVATDLVENGIHAGSMEFESDGAYYVLAAGMVIGLDGNVVCEVADLPTPFGPDEWVEVANRIKAAHAVEGGDRVMWEVGTKYEFSADYDYEQFGENEEEARMTYQDCVNDGSYAEVVLLRHCGDKHEIVDNYGL